MTSRLAAISCKAGPPSAVAELAWLLDLLVESAPYAEPALDELERSLLPGIVRLRGPIRERFLSLWSDRLTGCPELLLVAGAAETLEDDDPGRLLAWLSSLPRRPASAGPLLSEPPGQRRAVRRRLAMLTTDIELRRAYRDLLAEVWQVARTAWTRRGRAGAAKASAEWGRRLGGVTTAGSLVHLLPPRHPLTRDERLIARLLGRRRRCIVVPVYFCMSGGQVADLGAQTYVCVPASALEPIRSTRDAAFVADRARVLAEPTRVHILIHLMRSPSGVMQMTRALGMAQPTVSEHVRVLVRAGLIRAQRKGGTRVYFVLPARIDRWVEDIGGTLSRWVANPPEASRRWRLSGARGRLPGDT